MERTKHYLIDKLTWGLVPIEHRAKWLNYKPNPLVTKVNQYLQGCGKHDSHALYEALSALQLDDSFSAAIDDAQLVEIFGEQYSPSVKQMTQYVKCAKERKTAPVIVLAKLDLKSRWSAIVNQIADHQALDDVELDSFFKFYDRCLWQLIVDQKIFTDLEFEVNVASQIESRRRSFTKYLEAKEIPQQLTRQQIFNALCEELDEFSADYHLLPSLDRVGMKQGKNFAYVADANKENDRLNQHIYEDYRSLTLSCISEQSGKLATVEKKLARIKLERDRQYESCLLPEERQILNRIRQRSRHVNMSLEDLEDLYLRLVEITLALKASFDPEVSSTDKTQAPSFHAYLWDYAPQRLKDKNEQSIIYVPKDNVSLFGKINKARQRYLTEHDVYPSDEKVAQILNEQYALELSADKVNQVLAMPRQDVRDSEEGGALVALLDQAQANEVGSQSSEYSLNANQLIIAEFVEEMAQSLMLLMKTAQAAVNEKNRNEYFTPVKAQQFLQGLALMALKQKGITLKELLEMFPDLNNQATASTRISNAKAKILELTAQSLDITFDASSLAQADDVIEDILTDINTERTE